MSNQLANETSPYLLQHANNPVNWMPWGPAALNLAFQENKPIFLSIGYAACHWCHVMAHESFEDPKIAQIMNQYFINIKVDREERPDLDNIYMNAVVAMTGQGGWPMSLFLTPDTHPFYGGTYFPPDRRYGMPSFQEILLAAAEAWKDDPDELRRAGTNLTDHIDKISKWGSTPGETLLQSLLDQALRTLLDRYDWQNGGWGRAPRFPQPMAIEFLLLQASRGSQPALDAAVHNLLIMSRGGMYDVIGGGFSRYSTDDHWLIPHFEKMLYDNAQLALACLHAGLIAHHPQLIQICTETLDFILRELADPSGGFYSSLDADSEGEEGKYYTWTRAEIQSILEPLGEFPLFEKAFDLSNSGKDADVELIVLQQRARISDLAHDTHQTETEITHHLATARQALFRQRQQRVRPATDDKVLTSWNALALRAFAEAGRYLHRPDYIDAARKNAAFLLSSLHSHGVLLRSWRNGQARHTAVLEDYSALVIALLALYQTDPDPTWYDNAASLAREMIEHYSDPAGGFFDTHEDQEQLITRPKDAQDNATPCGNSMAAYAFFMLSEYSGNPDWRRIAETSCSSLQDEMVRAPNGFALWLQAVDFAFGPVQQVAIVGPAQAHETQSMIAALWEGYHPRRIAAISTGDPVNTTPELLTNRVMQNNLPTAYVCQGFTCKLPVTTTAELRSQLAPLESLNP